MDQSLGRKCAICGRGQSPRLGGLAGFAAAIEQLAKVGYKLADPKGRYAHIPCINKTRHVEIIAGPGGMTRRFTGE